jgi:predicted PhzF superfamily epimerase YddE/YHI9
MHLLRIAAFSEADRGSNPAGVMIVDAHPGEHEMQLIAAVFADANATTLAAA